MHDRFSRAQTFMWSNARLLERRLFDALFCGRSAQAVYTALKPYQNPDGGFGNALEPDKRVPESQPQDVLQAFLILDSVGLLGDPQVLREAVLPACDFLTTITTAEGGVPFSLPSANRYPHAPWWETSGNPPASLNPTADLCAVLLKSGVQHPWLERATAYCWEAIPASTTEDYHYLMSIISFLEKAPERDRAEAELARISKRIQEKNLVELDPAAQGYVKFPQDWAPRPDSFCRSLFDDATLQTHLQALADHQLEDGSWPIRWPTVSPGVEIEWKGRVIIETLSMLKGKDERARMKDEG